MRQPSRAVAGVDIGILCLDTVHQLAPGNVQNATSFGFPVRYEIVRDVSGPALMRGDRSAAAPVVDAARALEAAGVRVIVGACGSLAYFQSAVASAVQIPVFLSIMLEVPILLRALPTDRRLGVIFASTDSFTPRVREECGIVDSTRIVAIGADQVPAFRAILRQERDIDSPALEAGLVALAQETMGNHPEIGTWLLQCSDLPPYAAAIQRATGLPVFDMVTMIRHLHDALSRRPFLG
jgi:hypothetical protein